jgi:hypothetical protein
MDQARGAMNANGDRNKPLWLTEFGLKTQPDGSGASFTNDGGGEEAAQATMITNVFGFKELQGIFFYQLHDTSVYNSSGVAVKDVYWGIVSHDLSHRKQGFDAFQAAAVGALPPLALASSHTNGTGQGAVTFWYTSGRPSPSEVAWR